MRSLLSLNRPWTDLAVAYGETNVFRQNEDGEMRASAYSGILCVKDVAQ